MIVDSTAPKLSSFIQPAKDWLLLVVVGAMLASFGWFHNYSLRQELAGINSDQRDLLIDRHHQMNMGLSQLVSALQEQAFEFEVEQWSKESTQPDLEEMVEHFSHFLRRHPLYTQMRWIGNNGHERVRVNRKGSEVVVVAKKAATKQVGSLLHPKDPRSLPRPNLYFKDGPQHRAGQN